MIKYYVFCTVFLFLSCSAFGQLTSMNPATGSHAQVLMTTITGNGIFIQASSPAGNIFSIKLTRGSDVIEAYKYSPGVFGIGNVDVIDPNTADLELGIPITILDGVYDLEVIVGDTMYPNLSQTTYSLPGAFTILPPDGYITGTVFEDLNRDGIKDIGEPGIYNRRLRIQPYNVNYFTDSSGTYLYAVDNGNYEVAINQPTFDYRFLTTSNDTLNMVINNNNSPGNDFGFKTALVSVTPDFGHPGLANTHTLVADEPIFFPGANPAGNITYIQTGTSPIHYCGNITIIDSFTVQFTLALNPNTVIASNRDIAVYLNAGIGNSHLLKRQFNVIASPSAITGTVYHDLNRDGIKDAGEPGIPGYQVSNITGGVSSAPSAPSDSSGNYTCPAFNGNYSVKIDPILNDYMFVTSGDTISGTVNNNTSTGNDFGLKRAIVSITPNVAYKGLTTTHQIVADEPIFAGAFFYGVYILANPSTINIPAGSITVIDSVTIQVNVTIPMSTVAANNLDLYVRIFQGNAQNHYLKQKLNILPPPNSVTGKLFLDQNQNKVKDPGEPGITGGKLNLLPENSYGFSDLAGNFVVGSFGGIQTLSYANNISNIQLFTDSSSYTFNASGVVTDKDFGFLSNYPDYTLDIYSTYMRPRCNTNQYATQWFYNLGTINTDVVAWIKHDSLMTYVSSPLLPSSISGDTIFWNMPGMIPFSIIQVKALFLLPNAGDTVEVTYGVNAVDGTGTVQFTESTTVVYPVTCSYDPNDKQVTPPGVLAQNYTLMSDTLEYLIRFQNTGNDTAYNVLVLDTLDSNLELNTFEMLNSSHSMQTSIESNGATRFAFNNIMLPDSNVNEPESHGFIRYRILAKTGLPDNTPVNNTAHIFFDLNADVITNTTLNTMVYVLPTSIHETANTKDVVVYPNPFTNSATLYFENSAAEKFELHISNLTGNQVAPVQSTTGKTFIIQGNRMAKGIYFYELKQTTTGVSRYGKFIIE